MCRACGNGRAHSRGLCGRCYKRNWKAGTLDQFETTRGAGLQQMPIDWIEITYRQLDYWTRRGYLRAENPTPGSGRNRTWVPAEHRVAHAMARLIAAGLTVAAAHRVARGEAELAPGVLVLLDEPEAPTSSRDPGLRGVGVAG